VQPGAIDKDLAIFTVRLIDETKEKDRSRPAPIARGCLGVSVVDAMAVVIARASLRERLFDSFRRQSGIRRAATRKARYALRLATRSLSRT